MSALAPVSIREDLRKIRSDQFVERSERRFEIDGSDLMIGIRRAGQTNVLIGQALDLSRRGVKLEVTESLSFGESVSLVFWSDSAELDFTVEAEIRWFRKVAKVQKWVAGCLLDKPLPAEKIQALAQTHAIDRRKSRRHESEFHALARVATQQNPFQVVLLDYSSEGMRLLSKAPISENTSIKVLLPENATSNVEIQATSRWSRKFDVGYLVGCEVASPSQARFRECHDWIRSARQQYRHAPNWFISLQRSAKAAVFFLTLILTYVMVSSI